MKRVGFLENLRAGGIKNGDKKESWRRDLLVFQLVRSGRDDDIESVGRVSGGPEGVSEGPSDGRIWAPGCRLGDDALGVGWQVEGHEYGLDQDFEGCGEGMGRVSLEVRGRQGAYMLSVQGGACMKPPSLPCLASRGVPLP